LFDVFLLSFEKSFEIKAKWQICLFVFFNIERKRLEVRLNRLKFDLKKMASLDFWIKVYHENVFCVFVVIYIKLKL